MRAYFFSILFLTLTTVATFAQEYCVPLAFQPFLAGNFGELRPNHFHAGLDFKTQQTTGHPVHAFADGYVERVAINAYGYGLVLYVTHPEMRRMTVYAHLDSFSEKIWQKVRQRQLQEELNNADMTFPPDEIPVKMGEVIALSGNTGSSGGPHVHFEVRGLMSAPGADDEKWYDPMQYFLDSIKDTIAPRVSNIYIYNNPNTFCQQRRQIQNRTVTAWGKVGFGIKAYDYMDGTTNKFGVKRVRLYCDERLIYNWNQIYFQYFEQRFTNSVIDFGEWRNNRSMIMKTFVEPENRLRMIDQTVGDGVVEINEERPYKLRYELEDAHGNKSTVNFTVNGVRRETVMPRPKGRLVKAGEYLEIDTLGFQFSLPAGNLYRDADIRFECSESKSEQDLSPIYFLGNPDIPLHDYCRLEIIPADSLKTLDRLYVVNLDGGVYSSTKTEVREFGRFVVRRDTLSPTVTIVGKPSIRMITFTANDIGSGVKSWKVTIDGKFIPFDKNNKGRIVGHPDLYGIESKGRHDVEIRVYDLVGNETVVRHTI